MLANFTVKTRYFANYQAFKLAIQSFMSMSFVAASTTIEILKNFVEIIKDVANWNKEKIKEKRSLIEVLGNASSETKLALKKLRQGDQETKHDLQLRISNLWYQAAALLHDSDQETARMFMLKAQAWVDAENWSEEDFKTANDNLEFISHYIGNIISNK